jgi:iron complex transport system ATP-binding protein
MSSGESRRLLIGRALVYRPKALLLDEPCTSLDLRASHALRELLGKIARSGTGIVMVTHQITDVIPEIRRVLCLKAGALWKEGPKEKILTSRVLSQLFAHPLKVAKRAGYFHAW